MADQASNPDGRILLAYLIEKKGEMPGSVYFKATQFGATHLLMTAGANPKYTQRGEKVWLLYAIPQDVLLPGSKGGAVKVAYKAAKIARETAAAATLTISSGGSE